METRIESRIFETHETFKRRLRLHDHKVQRRKDAQSRDLDILKSDLIDLMVIASDKPNKKILKAQQDAKIKLMEHRFIDRQNHEIEMILRFGY